MNTEKLYYTDGRDVYVTATVLKARKKAYRLGGIMRHHLSTLKPPRAPGVIILTVGALIGFAGLFQVFPVESIPSVLISGRWATVNDYAIVAGGLLLIAGLISLIFTKRRYGVHITTASEETDIIVSKEREYIAQIVDGLDHALSDRAVGSD